jgi:hypothetical protein
MRRFVANFFLPNAGVKQEADERGDNGLEEVYRYCEESRGISQQVPRGKKGAGGLEPRDVFAGERKRTLPLTPINVKCTSQLTFYHQWVIPFTPFLFDGVDVGSSVWTRRWFLTTDNRTHLTMVSYNRQSHTSDDGFSLDIFRARDFLRGTIVQMVSDATKWCTHLRRGDSKH